jgi:hypothetical protein
MRDEFVEPTPTSRRRVIISVSAGVILGTVIALASSYLQSLPFCLALSWWVALSLLVVSIVVGAVGWQLSSIYRAVRCGQQPLPNANVLFRTRVFRGRKLYVSLAVQTLWWLALIGALVYVAPFANVLFAKARVYCAA